MVEAVGATRVHVQYPVDFPCSREAGEVRPAGLRIRSSTGRLTEGSAGEEEGVVPGEEVVDSPGEMCQ